MKRVVEPGATIGVLGGGQLGRMFALAARRLGYRVHVLSPHHDTPTGQVADREFHAAYEDTTAVSEFSKSVDVATFEFENVPFETTQVVDRYVPVYPAGWVLHATQNRQREKTFLTNAGIPVSPFQYVDSLADLVQVAEDFLPGVLKTAAWGYDGKGQAVIRSRDELWSAWVSLGSGPKVLEQFVDLECELSIVAVRNQADDFAYYGPILNVHRQQILDSSSVPVQLPHRVAEEAIEISRTIMDQLELVGVLCVEFFLSSDGKLLVNELAPRPHNSGHLTIDAHVTSQFEQHVRAVCGLPLGSTQQIQPAVMVNLLGDLWSVGPPQWESAIGLPNVKLHLYGKREPRPGRKMGHLTCLASDTDSALGTAMLARHRVSPQLTAAIEENQLYRVGKHK